MKKYLVPIRMLGGIVLSLLLIACAMAHSSEINLIKLAEIGDLVAIEKAIKNDANLEQRDWRLRTPLMAATHSNQIQVVLIEQGADVNAKDASLDSPYLYAGAKGLKEILTMTLTHDADLKSTNRYGGTALIPAAERGHQQVVQMLIDAGVDVNHLGWTALIEAIILDDGSNKYVDIVRRLINGGADVNLTDSLGNTPLKLAKLKRL